MSAVTESLTVDACVDADRDELFGFIRSTLPQQEAVVLLHRWAWKYGDLGDGHGRAGVLALRAQRRIVGMFGWRVFPGLVDGGEQYLTLLGDAFVDRPYRGPRRPGFPPWFRDEHPYLFGWSRRVPPRAAGSSEMVVSRVVPLVRLIGPRWFARSADDREPIRIDEWGSFDERVDDLWGRVKSELTTALVRDRRYLSWRFDECPNESSYIRLGASDANRTRGYVVVRCRQVGRLRIGYLVDYLADSPREVLPVLLGAALRRLRREGCTLAVTYASDSRYRRALWRRGFVPVPSRQRGYVVLRSHRSTAAAAAGFFDKSRWFLTLGDGDVEVAR